MEKEIEKHVRDVNPFPDLRTYTTISPPKVKSTVEWGEGSKVVVNLTQKFNLFQRIMWKIFFGAKVKNIKENKTTSN